MIDLTAVEQERVRVAMRALHAKVGGWKTIAPALGVSRKTVVNVACGAKAVSAAMAMRVARMAGVGVDDVLGGKYPPAGTCPHCGHAADRPYGPTALHQSAKSQDTGDTTP